MNVQDGGKRSLRRWGVMALATAVISGCASYPPPIPISQNHIQAEPQAKASGIPEPVKTSAFVPPPKAFGQAANL